jgi:hypothetical protein
MAMAGTKSASVVRAGAAVAEITIPVNLPPALDVADARGGATADAAPVDLSEAEVLALLNNTTIAAEPGLEPPGVADAVRGVSVSTWVQNVLVNALWSINQNRNAWAAFAGKGWQKFANNSDSAIMAFTTLASHARVAQGPTSYRQESDNMIHELYVW